MILATGERDGYFWLETDCEFYELLHRCPDIIVGRYAVIASADSGEFRPSETDVKNGWISLEGLAYSPQLHSPSDLPEPAGFDERYIFGTRPAALGRLRRDNPFTGDVGPGQVFAFVNYLGLRLSDRAHAIGELLWRQIQWMQPESWMGGGSECLMFATRREPLFEAARHTLAYIA